MSGLIRKVTGPAKLRLLKYYDEADKLLSSPVWVKTIKDDKQLAEELIEHMNTNVNLLARCNRDWKNLLKDLGTEKKAAEEKEYNHLAEGTKDVVEIKLNVNDAAIRLQVRLI